MEVLEPDNLALAAYHEAGHAVASCLLDIPFSHTTIMPSEEGGYVGYTKAVPKDNLRQQEVLDEMVVPLVAAPVPFGFHHRVIEIENDERVRVDRAEHLRHGGHFADLAVGRRWGNEEECH